MPFIHPAIFWTGLAAVSLPILIHLLNRRRFRMRDWAAMKFLLDSLRKNRRRLRIEELILLAIRCLAVLFLAAGIARFVGCGPMDLLPGSTVQRTTVFLLDDSCSMGQKAGGSTLFAAAITDLADRIRSLGQAQKVAVLLASRTAPEEAFFGLNFVTDPEGLLGRLQALRPSDARVRMAEAMETAGKAFADAAGDRNLVILSDFRKIDLASPEQAAALRKQFEALSSGGVKVSVIDYGRPAEANLTVESIDLLDKFAIAKVPVRLGLTVANNGKQRAENVEVSLTVRIPAGDGRDGKTFNEVSLPVQTIGSIDPGSTGRVEFQITPPQAGPMGIVASLPADELTGDNAAQLALDVREAIRVLVVDGKADAPDPLERESFFFVHAIDDGKGGYGNRAQGVGAAALAEVNVHDYDLVALLGVRELPSVLDRGGKLACPQLESLEEYVRGGGGLAIFTGERVNPTFYGGGGPFWAQGAGLLPFPIGPRGIDPAARKDFYRLDPKTLDGGDVLRTFAGESAILTHLIRFSGFNPADELAAGPLPDVKPPRVLARFDDPASSPAIVLRQFGKGATATFYTTAGIAWNDWATDPVGTYVAVMNDLMGVLARAQRQEFTARVGEPIVCDVPEALRDAEATLRTPDYPAVSSVALTADRKADGPRVLRYERPVRSGLYSLTLRVPEGESCAFLFARNVDGAEGNLVPGLQEDLAAAFGSRDFAYAHHGGEGATPLAEAERKKEYWIWAVAVALALLAAETFLGQRFGHYTQAAEERKENAI